MSSKISSNRESIFFATLVLFAILLISSCSGGQPVENPSQVINTPPVEQILLPSPSATALPRSTQTEALCPPDLRHEVDTFFDDQSNWFAAISSPAQFPEGAIYWCWSEIAASNYCPCELQSPSLLHCRVAEQADLATYQPGDVILIDVGMGAYSDCRLFYADLEIPAP